MILVVRGVRCDEIGGGGREVCECDDWFSTDSKQRCESLWLCLVALVLAMTDG